MVMTAQKLENSFLGLSEDQARDPSFWATKILPIDIDFWRYETGGNLCLVHQTTGARNNLLIQFEGSMFSFAHSAWDPTDHSKNTLFLSCEDPSTMSMSIEVLDGSWVPTGSCVDAPTAHKVIEYFLKSAGRRATSVAWKNAEDLDLPDPLA